MLSNHSTYVLLQKTGKGRAPLLRLSHPVRHRRRVPSDCELVQSDTGDKVSEALLPKVIANRHNVRNRIHSGSTHFENRPPVYLIFVNWRYITIELITRCANMIHIRRGGCALKAVVRWSFMSRKGVLYIRRNVDFVKISKNIGQVQCTKHHCLRCREPPRDSIRHVCSMCNNIILQ